MKLSIGIYDVEIKAHVRNGFSRRYNKEETMDLLNTLSLYLDEVETFTAANFMSADIYSALEDNGYYEKEEN